MRRAVALFLVNVAIAGCNSSRPSQIAMQLTDPQYQYLNFNEETGRKYVHSKKPGSTVVAGIATEKTWYQFGVPVALKLKNKSSQPIVFDAKQVHAFQNGRELTILDKSGVEQSIRGRKNFQEAQGFAGIVAGGLATGVATKISNAALSSTLASHSAGLIQSSTAKLDIAQEEAETLRDETNVFVAAESIPPQATTGGVLILEDMDGSRDPVTLEVTMGREQHKFMLARE